MRQPSGLTPLHKLIVKETAFEFFPPHKVVDITPIPPETKVVLPCGGLNTKTSTVPGWCGVRRYNGRNQFVGRERQLNHSGGEVERRQV
jgi:hypothetical protein